LSADKRRAPRLVRRFILRAAPFGEEPPRWSFVTIHNLSATGVLFTYDKPVYEGMRLRFKIDFPDRMIECVGRVVRIEGVRGAGAHDLAAHLEGLRPEDRYFLESFVRQNLP
jgi:hypothetical protein